MGHRSRRGSGQWGIVALRILAALFAVFLLVGAGLAGPGHEYGAFVLWWLTNSEPPEVRLVLPGPAVRGAVEVDVETSPAGRVAIVGAELDGRAIPAEPAPRIDTRSLPDGEHVVAVRVEDRSLRRNSASASLRFRSDNTAPVLHVETRPPEVAQGHTAVIHVRPDEPAELQASLAGKPLPLYPAGQEYWAVVGVGPEDQPGARELLIEGRDRVGNSGRASAELAVKPNAFTRDTIQVSEAMLALLAPGVRSAEDEKLRAVYATENGPPRWKGAFFAPVSGPITTEFGEVRSYNGGPFQGHHLGTDFQIGMDAPVQAPAAARVALRDEVRLRGKILVLDHGGGVYSTYAHLADWRVDVGQEVQARQIIGTVGSSGLSTGPHLHWEIWVNGQPVDPLEWTEREVP